MIIQETLKINGKNFIKTYSDKLYKIRKIGTSEIYEEAIDLVESNFNYEETDEKIVEDIEETTNNN